MSRPAAPALPAAEEASEDAPVIADPALRDALSAVAEWVNPTEAADAGSGDEDEAGTADLDSDDETYDAAAPALVEPPTSETIPKRNPSPKNLTPDPTTNASQLRWEATFAPEGKATDDGRMFWPGSIQWRTLPLSLMAMVETSEGGHIGAELAGRIDNIWRDGSLIRASGVFDDGEYGSEIARLVGDGTLRGLSVDIAAREYEFLARDKVFDENGDLRPDALEQPDAEEKDLLDILFGGDEDMLFVVTDGVIGMATVCPFPAFEDAQISLSAGGMVWTLMLQGGFTVTREELGDAPEPEEETLTASAAGMAPLKPPAHWFDDPELSELTPLTVTDDGQVFGHAACWDACHIGIPDACTTAPHSITNYAYFLLGEVETEEGDMVSVGKVTLGTGHADRRLGRAATAEHYDNSGAATADVNAGEDEFGIWIAGALRPDVPAERVREFRASVISGDWRNVNGNLELVALLAVNVPGFPIPRPRALVSSGEEGPKVLALTAAGIHDGRTIEDLTPDDLAKLRALRARATGGLQGLAELVRGGVAPEAEELAQSLADEPQIVAEAA